MNEEKRTIDLKLDELRAEIDSVDVQLAVLLERRFSLTREIGKTKGEIGRQIKDEARERIVLDKVAKNLGGSENLDSVMALFKLLMQLSVEQQTSGLEEFEAESRARNGANADSYFSNICIIGAGLIGGALAWKIKDVFARTQLRAVDLPDVVAELEASGIFTTCASEINQAIISSANLIVIGCPPDASLDVLKELAPFLRQGQLVIDLCSVKQTICDLASSLDLHGAEFVGVHPFFGTEKSGFEHSADVPLSGKTICIVATSKSDEPTLSKLSEWFNRMDLRVFRTDAKSHDATVAVTSHLIQLMASSLGSVIHQELISAGKADHLALSGGALAGLSRLMASKPQIWSQIVGQNHGEIERLLRRLIDELNALVKASSTDRETFAEIFERAAEVNRTLGR
jgi:prephenate dehydrogenase